MSNEIKYVIDRKVFETMVEALLRASGTLNGARFLSQLHNRKSMVEIIEGTETKIREALAEARINALEEDHNAGA